MENESMICVRCDGKIKREDKICPHCGLDFEDDKPYEPIVKDTTDRFKDNNAISDVLKSCAYVIWLIAVAIFIVFAAYDGIDFGISSVITVVSIGINGLIVYAFGEIIEILHDIRKKLYKKDKKN